jgi:hypothetical protein
MKAWLKNLSLPAASLGLLYALAGLPGLAMAEAAEPAAPAPMAPMPPQMAMPQPAPTPAPPQVMGMDFTGYVDVGVEHFTTGRGKFAATTPDGKNFANARTFDFANDQPTLQNLSLRLNKVPDSGFGGMIDLTLGQDADTIAAYGTIDTKKGPAGGANQMADVTQLFAYYGFGSGSVILGKYVTHAGQEVITSRDDTNYSRSILFGFAIPFTHTGVRANYKASDTLNLMLGANEGWDTVTGDNGTAGEFDGEWAPSKRFSLFWTYLSGDQQTNYYAVDSSGKVGLSKVKGNRSLVDLVFTLNATDALSLVLNYDGGSQDKVTKLDGKTGTDTWSGAAFYINYGINDDWRTSIRAESFTDSDGYRVPVESGKTKGPTWSEGTLTVAFMGIKNTEIRGEVRSDTADQKIFVDDSSSSKPPSNGGTKLKAIDTMTSVGLEVLYKF